MNFLFIGRDELVSPSQAKISGARVRSVQERHDLKPDITVRAVLEGHGLGQAHILSIGYDHINLTWTFEEGAPTRVPIQLLVAVPRPQTVKKLIQLVASCGLQALHFVKSERVVASYLQSRRLRDDEIREEIIKSLEQVGDCGVPEVKVHYSLAQALAQLVPGASLCLVANQGAQPLFHLGREGHRVCANVILALGPEKGWSEAENHCFANHHFFSVGLGSRMYRVEIAAALLVGQLLGDTSLYAPL